MEEQISRSTNIYWDNTRNIQNVQALREAKTGKIQIKREEHGKKTLIWLGEGVRFESSV
jgi:hypothetical protein